MLALRERQADHRFRVAWITMPSPCDVDEFCAVLAGVASGIGLASPRTIVVFDTSALGMAAASATNLKKVIATYRAAFANLKAHVSHTVLVVTSTFIQVALDFVLSLKDTHATHVRVTKSTNAAKAFVRELLGASTPTLSMHKA